MTFGLVFWVLMLIWLVFSVWQAYPTPTAMGNSALLFILFLLLGWRVFGAPLHS